MCPFSELNSDSEEEEEEEEAACKGGEAVRGSGSGNAGITGGLKIRSEVQG